jgi:hypothetical protein
MTVGDSFLLGLIFGFGACMLVLIAVGVFG